MIVIIDNYDSFTYNIFQVVSNQTSEEVKVIRNDDVSIADLDNLPISHLIISPGPGRPEDAGISVEAIRHFCSFNPNSWSMSRTSSYWVRLWRRDCPS